MNRNIEFILTKINLGMLENREYKINTIMVLLFDSSIVLVTLILLLVLEQVSSITNWTINQYILFILFALVNGKIAFALTFRNFNQLLLSGDFAMYLNKPISPFLFLLTQQFNGANMLSLLIIAFPLAIGFSLLQEYVLLAWIIFFIGTIQCLTLFWSVELTSFFAKNNEFISRPTKRLVWFFEEYVPLFFKNTSFFSLLGLIPSVIFSFLAVEVARGSFEYVYLLYYAIPTIPLFALLSYVMYKKGIEKYEAFG